jgi:hypothetical protein
VLDTPSGAAHVTAASVHAVTAHARAAPRACSAYANVTPDANASRGTAATEHPRD